MPDILYDGIPSPAAVASGEPWATLRLGDNGEADFANFNMPDLTPKKIFGGKYRPLLDDAPRRGVLPAVARVDLEPLSPPDLGASAPSPTPTRLSAWPIFGDRRFRRRG